jgi:NADH-quinone oxidoreductase subunit A
LDGTPVWPLVVYLVAVALLTAAVIALSAVLGERHKERATGEPFESGILPTGSARLHFSAKFYLIAMFFVIFDLEAIFVFAWAVAAPELGWTGYWGILFFIAMLIAALIYLWRLGALDWGPCEERSSHIRKQDESLQTRI